MNPLLHFDAVRNVVGNAYPDRGLTPDHGEQIII